MKLFILLPKNANMTTVTLVHIFTFQVLECITFVNFSLRSHTYFLSFFIFVDQAVTEVSIQLVLKHLRRNHSFLLMHLYIDTNSRCKEA